MNVSKFHSFNVAKTRHRSGSGASFRIIPRHLGASDCFEILQLRNVETCPRYA